MSDAHNDNGSTTSRSKRYVLMSVPGRNDDDDATWFVYDRRQQFRSRRIGVGEQARRQGAMAARIFNEMESERSGDR